MKTHRNPVPALASLAGLAVAAGLAVPVRAEGFTRLVPVPAPKVVRCAEEYPGGSYKAAHLVDGNPRTEYSSNGKGAETFVEFAFDGPVRLAAFRHLDRNDPATIAASELALLDANGDLVATVPVEHTGERAGVAINVFPVPIEAHAVRWRVKRLGPRGYGTVGGAEIQFFGAGEVEPEPKALTLSARLSPVVERAGANLFETLRLDLGYPYAEDVKASVKIEGLEPREVELGFPSRTLEYRIPAPDAERALRVEVEAGGKILVAEKIVLRPPRRWEIHLLPHSHVDIGYTEHQRDVEKKQNENLEIALELIRRTRGYPEGSRFKWNVEVLWPVENYLRAATPEKRAAFLDAVRSGDVGLDAFYGNILTGLCRPEELIRLLSYATRLSALAGVPIESAMISDVPGYTWSTVSAMAHAGVRYFSFAPNYFDRMGATMVTWQDKPFWWVGPDRRTRVLCWCPSRGYALGHLIGPGDALARFLPSYLEELEAKGYPYDLTYLRWNVHGDNGAPDEKIADVVRDWNARFAWPRVTIQTTAATFREFERRYGDRLPEYAGDYTPYWEDGAGSSAFETALNRASAERLVQAETLWALRNPGPFPAEAFHEAWRNVLLYSEHTWGAHNSVSQPDLPFVLEQWKTKRAFALDADRQSRELLERALPGVLGARSSPAPALAALPIAIDVYNTASFARTDLVAIPVASGARAVRVLDDRGNAVPSQRLSTGEIAFVARDVPGFGARRYRLEEGAPARPERGVKADGTALEHPEFFLRIDEKTGAIASFRSSILGEELVDAKAAVALNDYIYLPGADPKGALRAGAPRISVREPGPVVASLAIESEAPGCRKLLREVRVIAGIDRVEITNVVDKTPVRKKEGVHFGFGFRVPDGTVRIDVGLAAVRPEADQIPASCKNWFSVQRWVDISNADYGVTWAPVDAPLLELGGLTANLLGSQTDHRVWIQRLEPTQTIYSWVMNNHWHTNYRAEQEGPVAFRYAIRPHRAFSPAEAARFGIGVSQPLLAAAAQTTGAAGGALAPVLAPPLRIEAEGAIATAFKPSDDGRAWIVRLFGASGRDERVSLVWAGPKPAALYFSDTSERPLRPFQGELVVPAWGLVTLRSEKQE